jgi:hypothetical protein
MPTRERARFLRGVVRILLCVGVLGGFFVGASVLSEIHARLTWPVAHGEVVAANVKTGGNFGRQQHTNYYVEYEIRYGVPVDQCLTGTLADEGGPLACRGIVRTRRTGSSKTANDWRMRHGLNSSVEILHDPNGPSVKIVGESSWLVYPVREISVLFVWMAIFLIFLNITNRRLQCLESLASDHGASTAPSSITSKA